MKPRGFVGLFILLSTIGVRDVRAQGDPIFAAAGLQQNHDYFSGMPGEHIDSKSGALILTFTDLVLPGNAGGSLRFERTYNSKTGNWSLGVAGLPMAARFDRLPYDAGVYVMDRTRTWARRRI